MVRATPLQLKNFKVNFNCQWMFLHDKKLIVKLMDKNMVILLIF